MSSQASWITLIALTWALVMVVTWVRRAPVKRSRKNWAPLEFSINPDLDARLTRLEWVMGLTRRQDVLETAINLLETSVEHDVKGCAIAAVKKGRVVNQFIGLVERL